MTAQLTLFDYAALDTETRIAVQQRIARLHDKDRKFGGLMRQTIETAWEIGEELYGLQQDLDHGLFLPCIRSEFPHWSQRSIYNFINVHKNFKFANFASLDIGLSAAYLLAAPSTPELVRSELIARAEQGEPITYSTARERIEEDQNSRRYDGFAQIAPPNKMPIIPLVSDEEEEGLSCYGSCIHAVVLSSDYDRFFCKKFECDYHINEGRELAPECEFYQETLDDAECAELSLDEPEQEPGDWYSDGPEEAESRMSQPMRLLTSQGTIEWYTPPEIIDRAREVLGDIDLDPASNAIAQLWIQAKTYYTLETPPDAPWIGRIWLNPPFKNTPVWVDRLDSEYISGEVSAAILLVNSAPGYIWWEDLWRRRPVCMLRERLCFWTPEGKQGGQAKKGTTIAYYGENVQSFIAQFSDLGRIILPED